MDFGEKHVWTNQPQTQNLLISIDKKDFIELSQYNYNGNSIAVANFSGSSLYSKSKIVSFPEFLNAVFQAERNSPHTRPQFKK
jgi:spermidine synthase